MSFLTAYLNRGEKLNGLMDDKSFSVKRFILKQSFKNNLHFSILIYKTIDILFFAN